MRLLVWTLVAVALLGTRSVAGVYSNSIEIDAVTTFTDCNNATDVDPATQAAVCIGDNNPITVIEYFVLPNQNDQAGGNAIEFFTYPQPFTNANVNQQNGAPPDNPCAQASGSTNCSYWKTPGTNDTGPITMTVKVSNVVRKYKVIQILDKKRAPYSYLNHASIVPKCSKDFCVNGCSTEDFNECDPANGQTTKRSFFACCAIQDDYVGALKDDSAKCSDEGGFTENPRQQGNLFAQANEFYDYSAECGDSDMDLLYNYGLGVSFTDQGAFTRSGSCRSCRGKYGYASKTVANRGPKYQGGNGCPKTTKGNNEAPVFTTYDLPYPTTMPDLCPIPAAHSYGYPATTGDRESGANSDAFVAEPYYYWCQANCVGTASYTSKKLKPKYGDWSRYAEGCDVGNPQEKTDVKLSTLVTPGGEQQDMYAQYMRAYDCGIDKDTCPQLVFASDVIDSNGYACCNTTFNQNGVLVSTCNTNNGQATLPDADTTQSCGGIAYEQVQNAVSYLTAACDADDSGEILCGDNCIGDQQNNLGYGWSCPGSLYDHITPSVVSQLWDDALIAGENKQPCTSADNVACTSSPGTAASDFLNVVKCSAECQSDPFIRYTSQGNKQCSGNKCKTNVESLTAQKAIVSLGGPDCKIYQVVPQPILDVSIAVTFTDPSGNFATTELSSDGTAPAFGTANLDNVAFTTRINEVYSVGTTGPQIPGYFAVCGLNAPVPPAASQDRPCTNIQGSDYNPYDPDDADPGDDDISIKKPSDDAYCNSGDSNVQFRGIFPGDDPHDNPWPKIIRKMVQARQQNGEPVQKGTGPDSFHNEAYACATPSPRYLGVLNCGKPVYYYYIPEERKTSYGTGCGQVGVQNDFVTDAANARTMCLQDDNSCTPGYGLPKFTASNSPFFQTPCRELGNMAKTFRELYDAPSGKLNVCDGKTPQAWNMPGFFYMKDTDDYEDPTTGGKLSVDGMPNTWFHEGYIYQQMSATDQQQIRFDMSTYTDTYFGGNVETFAGGNLVLDQENTTICVATVGSQPGILVIGVENTNLQSGGTYALEVYCVNPQDNSNLTANSQDGGAELQPNGAGILTLEVGAGKTVYVNWGISAVGYVPGSDTDSTGELPDDDSIGLPTCTITLFNGPLATPNFQIAKEVINCNLLALTIIQNTKKNDLLTDFEFQYNCGQYSFVVMPFCWIANAGPIRTVEILFIMTILGIGGAILAFCGIRGIRSDELLHAKEMEFVEKEHKAEVTKEERQALLTKNLVQKTIEENKAK